MKLTKETAGSHKRKILLFLLCAVFVSTITLHVFAQDNILPESITVTPTAVTIAVRETRQLTHKVAPASATNKTVEWASSDKDIAEVSQNGLVTGKKKGDVKITVTSKENGVVGSCEVKVVEVAPKTIKISPSKAELFLEETIELSAVFNPANTTNQEVTWTSNNEEIATVQVEDGVVTIKATDKLQKQTDVTINAVAKALPDGKNTATCKITVKPIRPKTIRVTPSMTSIIINEEKEVTFELNPVVDIYEDTVVWSSTDKKIATVEAVKDDKGNVGNKAKIKAIKAGTVTIKAKTINGKTDTCIVNVQKAPESISCNGEVNRNMTLKGGDIKLTADVNPTDTSGLIIWESDNTACASVTSDGKINSKGKSTATVKAVGVGKCTITARSSVKDIEPAAFTVTIEENLPQSYKIEGEKKIKVGQSPIKLKATNLKPAKTDAIWESDNPQVATVSATGLVTGKKPGQAKISLKVAEGSNRTFFTVTVLDKYSNETFKKATNIANNVTVSDASLYPEDDVDFYAFSLTEKSDVTVNLLNIPQGCTYDLFLYKKADEKALYADTTKIDKSKNYNIITETLDPGKYYIKAGYSKGDSQKTYSSEYYKLQLVTGPEKSTPASVMIGGVPESKLTLGDMVKLTAVVSPSNARNKSVIWTSSDPDVATVTESGLVRVVTSAGKAEAVITARTSLGAREAFCTIEVENIPPESIKISPAEDLRVGVNSTLRLTAEVTPDNASNKSVVWVSDDSTVAAVSADGVVTGRTAGKTNITAKIKFGEETIFETREIKVAAVDPQSLELSHKEVELKLNSTMPVTATVKPANASDKSVRWESSDPSVVAVYGGILYGLSLSEKSVEITAISNANEEIMSTCLVKVTFQNPTGVTVSPSVLRMGEGETKKLSAAVMPNTASDKSLEWESSDETVVTVNEDGVITAVPGAASEGEATATITARTKVEGKEGKCTVTVHKEIVPKSVSVSPQEKELNVKSSFTLDEEDSFTLEAEVSPATATNKAVRWSSSDTSVATVSSDGVVTGIGEGNAIISATTKSGSLRDFCKVTVKVIEAEEITIYFGNDKGTDDGVTDIKLRVGKPYEFTAGITPGNTTYRDISWSNSNAKVAGISDQGIFTPKEAGKTTITAAASNGVFATCNILVMSDAEPPTKVSIKGSSTILLGRKANLTASVSPAECTNKEVKWTSSDENIATVDETGEVEAHALGKVTITATTEVRGKKDKIIKSDKKITVKPVTPSSLKVMPSAVEISKDETKLLIVDILPNDITKQSLVWKVDKGNIEVEKVEAGADGKIVASVKGKAKGADKVTFTVTSEEEKKTKKSATCKITVVADPESLKIEQKKDFDEKGLKIGKNYPLKAVITPEEAADRVVTWSSSDTSVAEVSKKGVITAKGSGDAVITAMVRTAADSSAGEATYEISVEPTPPKSIKLPKTLKIGKGELKTLTAKIAPDNTTKTLIWSSDYPEVVKVSGNGIVEGLALGRATITAYSAVDNKIAGECEVTVVDIPPGSVKITPDLVKNVYPGEEVQLTAVVSPSGCSNKEVNWVSTDERVAKVDNDGLVELLNPGEVTIKATTKAVGTDKKYKTAICKIVVKPITADELTIKPDSVTLSANGTQQLDFDMKPMEVTNKVPSWKTTNSKIATVSDDGMVTARKKGSATISVTVGGKMAKCKVTVATDPSSGITVKSDTMTLSKGETGILVPTVEPKTADQGVSYKSSNANVAAIADDGTVTAIGVGICEITVRSDAGNFEASCVVTIYEQPTVNLKKDKIDLGINRKEDLKDYIENGNKYELIWGSSAPDVASVDEDGNVTGIAEGRATITAFPLWGEPVSFTVTVK